MVKALDRASVDAQISAPAKAVWDFLRWDNLESMLPSGLFAGVDYDERRPVAGATRSVRLPDGRTIRERLERVDPVDLAFDYRVIDLADFPLAEYDGQVRVEAVTPASCKLHFACQFEPLGISADEWRSIYSDMQDAYIAFIRSSVER